MMTILTKQPDSPNGAFEKAVESLKDTLGDPTATLKGIADAFVKVLELLDAVPVEKSVHAAAKAVVAVNFRAVCREFLDGHTGMGVRRGASKDIDLHGKKVLLYAWM
jgi:hypothetical protein